MTASDRARRLVQGDTGTTSGTQVWFGREADAYKAGVAAGRAEERDECARLAEQSQVCPDVRAFANLIRARSQP